MASLSAKSKAVLAKAAAYKTNTASAVKKTQASVSPVSKIANKVNTVQTSLASFGLGEATKKAQQALSEKYGISTFDVKGDISTVPTTRPIDTSIDVGTGRLTRSSYTDSVAILTQQAQTAVLPQPTIFNNPIVSGITEFFDQFFHTENKSEIPDEIKAKIQEIDDKILEVTARHDKEIAEIDARPTAGDFRTQESDRAYKIARNTSYQNEINALNKQRDQILLEYKASVEIVPKIELMIKGLDQYAVIDRLTPLLKTEIEDRIQQASELIQTILEKSIKVPQEILNRLNKSILLAVNVIKLPVQAAQDTATANMDGTAEMIDLFGTLGTPKSIDDRVKEIIADYRAQKQAITVLLQTGEFSK